MMSTPAGTAADAGAHASRRRLSCNAHMRCLPCRVATKGNVMRLAKTEKAHTALEAGKAGPVDLRDRRILILADGQRTRAELIAMLGADRAASIDRLLQEGYLGAPGMRAEAAEVAPVVAESAPAPAKRRSLVAAKMYLLDMLELQRTPESAALRAAIQSTTEPAALLERLLQSLEHLRATTPSSYGERIRTRFAEVVPDDALWRIA